MNHLNEEELLVIQCLRRIKSEMFDQANKTIQIEVKAVEKTGSKALNQEIENDIQQEGELASQSLEDDSNEEEIANGVQESEQVIDAQESEQVIEAQDLQQENEEKLTLEFKPEFQTLELMPVLSPNWIDCVTEDEIEPANETLQVIRNPAKKTTRRKKKRAPLNLPRDNRPIKKRQYTPRKPRAVREPTRKSLRNRKAVVTYFDAPPSPSSSLTSLIKPSVRRDARRKYLNLPIEIVSLEALKKDKPINLTGTTTDDNMQLYFIGIWRKPSYKQKKHRMQTQMKLIAEADAKSCCPDLTLHYYEFVINGDKSILFEDNYNN